MMEQEPFFLVNEFLEKEKKEFEDILTTIEGGNIRNKERTVFLRNFTNELFKAYKKTKKSRVMELDKEKTYLEQKRKELLKKLEEAKNKLVNKTTEEKHVIEAPAISEEKELILSKESGKPLVKTEFDGKSYKVIEPTISEQDKKLLDELKTYRLDENSINQVQNLCKKYNILFSKEYYDKLRYYLVRDKNRYGKISPLLEDKDVKEIVCNGKNQPLTINYKEKHEIPTNIKFDSDEEINNFIKLLALKSKQNLSSERPFFNAIIDNMTINGTLGTEFIKPKFVIMKTTK